VTHLNAVTDELTDEEWKEEQQRSVTTRNSQTADATRTHADAANCYEQTIIDMRDLLLWPWE